MLSFHLYPHCCVLRRISTRKFIIKLPRDIEVGVKHNEAMGLVGWVIPVFSQTFIEN